MCANGDLRAVGPTDWDGSKIHTLPRHCRAARVNASTSPLMEVTTAGPSWRSASGTTTRGVLPAPDGAATGGNGCRTWVLANGVVVREALPGGGHRFVVVDKWVLNSMVRFR